MVDAYTIQALVLYNRTNNSTQKRRAIGLAIELYNRTEDPTLSTPLVSTNEITTAVNIYRYDFPEIDTYSDFVGSVSTTNIVNDTYSTKEIVSITTSNLPQFVISGDLTSNTITTTGNATITGNISIGGTLSNPNQPCFKAIRITSTETIIAGENLKYNSAVIDTNSSFDTTTHEYTIPVDGNWYFIIVLRVVMTK